MPYRELFEPYVRKYIGCDLPGNDLADNLIDPSGVLPFNSSSVDIVLSSQVLEHVEDPSLYLNEAHRILKAKGVLILSTHGIWRFHPDPTDFRRWTCDGLRREIDRAKFEIIHFKGIMVLRLQHCSFGKMRFCPESQHC
jgi:SAM-dependent methyltransferase